MFLRRLFRQATPRPPRRGNAGPTGSRARLLGSGFRRSVEHGEGGSTMMGSPARKEHPPLEYVEAYVQYAITLSGAGEYDRAMTAIEKALEIDPGNAVALVNRGAVWFLKGRLRKAAHDFTEAILRAPALSLAYYNRAQTHTALGHVRAAIADYSHVLMLEPDHREALNNRGVLQVRRGCLAEALSDFDHALVVDPNDVEAHFNRALARLIGGNIQGARSDFNDALECAPKDWPLSHIARKALDRIGEKGSGAARKSRARKRTKKNES